MTGVLTLQSDVYLYATSGENGRFFALFILSISGISLAVGQSVVLFANRIPKQRYFLSLTGGAIVLLAAALVWSVLIWLLTVLFGWGERPLIITFTVVGMSFAPLWFGVLVLIPVLGVWLGKLLRLWVFVCVFVGISAVYMLGFWQTLFCCLMGWLLVELLSEMPIFDMHHLRRWLWRETSGLEKQATPEQLADELAKEVHIDLVHSDEEQENA